ncbi:hypothetical protein DUNSADRAFT_3838 [Dunaliella salina]|uniref:Uncharacterized protein n=1 Tax=Dunaliella salina TaxID=3046 RepID=A0ABQ7GT72_DUNSA|nr:hypothetical protein DUNSADRAFT_3838 [Dunaliella salina]|eukprot:KAF5837822.1 hypothetical protein DUNSADRAFT_3838 [Dunaliella salina]
MVSGGRASTIRKIPLYSTESPELAGALNMHFELLEMLQQEARETRGKGQLLSDRQWMRLKHVLAQRKTNWMQDVREPSAIL